MVVKGQMLWFAGGNEWMAKTRRLEIDEIKYAQAQWYLRETSKWGLNRKTEEGPLDAQKSARGVPRFFGKDSGSSNKFPRAMHRARHSAALQSYKPCINDPTVATHCWQFLSKVSYSWQSPALPLPQKAKKAKNKEAGRPALSRTHQKPVDRLFPPTTQSFSLTSF